MTGEVDTLAHRFRPARGEPEGALVLFHGRGTSEHDLYPLFDAVDPEGRLAGVTPRGPLALPPGGAHWYIVRQVGYPDRETFEGSLERAEAFVDAVPDMLGVPLERTVLGGFSQGAVMSYALGLGRDRPRPGGILAMSGFIPTVEGFGLDLEGLAGYPVAITHGTLDPIMDVRFGREAAERLREAGAEVEYHEASIAHHIDPAWIPALGAWLRGVVAGGERAQRG